MSKQDFISLYEKFLSGQCSEEEKTALENYYAEIKLMDNEWDTSLGDEGQTRKLIIAKIRLSADSQVLQVKEKRLSFVWMRYAAFLLMVVMIGMFSWYYMYKPEVINQKASNIRPGKNSAYLTLASGKSITLNEEKSGQIVAGGGVVIKKINDSLLSYSSNNNVDKPKKVLLIPDSNSLTTPRGGIYQTVLSDGTKVWLNSESSLKYPVIFAGKERKVVLVGEAYFEVAKNKAMPFKVCVNGMDVEVLGTHFNVMGYPNEKEVKTTLLEGSVKLHSKEANTRLVPGQQGLYSSSNTGFTVKKVSTADEVAWKDGFFVFDNQNIKSTMMNIGRWYNVEVVFQNKLNPRNFGGTISRYRNLDLVLKALEATGSVHFKIAGRRVIVMD